MIYSIGVCGDSGSGKTTLSKKLSTFLGDCVILECDRYHKWERGDDHWNTYTHLNTESNHLDQMKSDVSDLLIGKSVIRSDYDHDTGRFTSPETLDPKKNLVVCGLHSLYCDDIFNLKVYMDTDDRLRTFWKISRDTANRGYTFNSVKKQIEDRKEDFIKYILPQKEWADVIVNFYSETDDRVKIAKGIETKLRIFIKNLDCKESFEKAYKQKGIKVKISESDKYSIIEFLNYNTFSGNYYDYIILAINELL